MHPRDYIMTRLQCSVAVAGEVLDEAARISRSLQGSLESALEALIAERLRGGGRESPAFPQRGFFMDPETGESMPGAWQSPTHFLADGKIDHVPLSITFAPPPEPAPPPALQRRILHGTSLKLTVGGAEIKGLDTINVSFRPDPRVPGLVGYVIADQTPEPLTVQLPVPSGGHAEVVVSGVLIGACGSRVHAPVMFNHIRNCVPCYDAQTRAKQSALQSLDAKPCGCPEGMGCDECAVGYWDGQPLTPSPPLSAGSLETERLEALREMGQACVDWYLDTGECHFCEVITGPGGHTVHHDDDCPVDLFLKRYGHEGQTPEELRAAIVAAFEAGFGRSAPTLAEQRVPPRVLPSPTAPYVPAIDEFDLLPDAKGKDR